MTAPAKAPMIPPLFRAALKAAGLPMPVPELRFHPTRKWRFDYGWEIDQWDIMDRRNVPCPGVALEVEGGVWVQGRHTRGSGFVRDMEKYNEAAAQGWRILRVTPDRLCHPDTLDLIRRALDT